MPLRLPGECLEVVKAVPGAQGNVFLVLGGVLECPRVSWGYWRVYVGLWGMSDGIFPPICFNFRKSHMRSLSFRSGPEGPKCLKYQNVPTLRSF